MCWSLLCSLGAFFPCQEASVCARFPVRGRLCVPLRSNKWMHLLSNQANVWKLHYLSTYLTAGSRPLESLSMKRPDLFIWLASHLLLPNTFRFPHIQTRFHLALLWSYNCLLYLRRVWHHVNKKQCFTSFITLTVCRFMTWCIADFYSPSSWHFFLSYSSNVTESRIVKCVKTKYKWVSCDCIR